MIALKSYISSEVVFSVEQRHIWRKGAATFRSTLALSQSKDFTSKVIQVTSNGFEFDRARIGTGLRGVMAHQAPLRVWCFMAVLLLANMSSGFAQTSEQTLSGSDAGEHAPADRTHLLGDWGGVRSKLLKRGIDIDLLYAGDFFSNVRSAKQRRLSDFSRGRGTVDIDFSKLTHTPGLTFHITAVHQSGNNFGAYLGSIAGPSGLASANTFRLDSYWFQTETENKRVIARIGQFAGQDFYGIQPFSTSFVIEPVQYAFGNLNSTTFETFDPPSTPAAELRVLPTQNMYVKGMVFSDDRAQYSHNPTGFVPDFHGSAGSAYEIGYGRHRQLSAVHPQDTLETRKGYSKLYQVGAVLNPGKFTSTASAQPVSGNYVVYAYASQAIYRTSPGSARGLDLSIGDDWSPPDRSRNNQELTIALRFNEPFSFHFHNTIQAAYVRSGINQAFPVAPPVVSAHTAEHAFELSTLIDVSHGVVVQPVLQYFINTGGSSHSTVILGFHSRVDF